jgi:hypothetical protein
MHCESRIATRACPTMDRCDTSVLTPCRKSSIVVLSPRLSEPRAEAVRHIGGNPVSGGIRCQGEFGVSRGNSVSGGIRCQGGEFGVREFGVREFGVSASLLPISLAKRCSDTGFRH